MYPDGGISHSQSEAQDELQMEDDDLGFTVFLSSSADDRGDERACLRFKHVVVPARSWIV